MFQRCIINKRKNNGTRVWLIGMADHCGHLLNDKIITKCIINPIKQSNHKHDELYPTSLAISILVYNFFPSQRLLFYSIL